jgi:sterol desaturase/sphingolipid hydroxylase (fatty acid hydroxylase superfamily)
MYSIWWVPLIAFVMLVALERATGPADNTTARRADHLLNLAGLAVQGIAVPAAGYGIAMLLAQRWPQGAGTLAIGWWGAFLLNFVFIDFLYYWQHRLFHRVPALWALHQCHHASTQVNVWATSRNSLFVNFLFVYLLVNPLLGYLCDRPDGFFAAAAVTAALDLWRHSRLPAQFAPPLLGKILITPPQHHLHHSPDQQHRNFGANLALWDWCFGTLRATNDYPATYGTAHAPSAWRQFLRPW